jgi:hypothetical protein
MDSEPIAGSYLATLRGIGYLMSIKRLLPDDQNEKQRSFGKDFPLSFRHGFQDHEQLLHHTKFF